MRATTSPPMLSMDPALALVVRKASSNFTLAVFFLSFLLLDSRIRSTLKSRLHSSQLTPWRTDGERGRVQQ